MCEGSHAHTIRLVEELGDKELAQQSSDAGRVCGIGKLTPHEFPEGVQQSHLLKGRHDLRRLAKVKSVFPSLAEIVTVAQGAQHLERAYHMAAY